VAHVLELYRRQMATTMLLAGCDDVASIGLQLLA
jgi:isopentenyl diphosphate isomerase/L-lactate dehydrogenase-like FMN-dependent dehydrogenase